jgi:hypothetical protein
MTDLFGSGAQNDWWDSDIAGTVQYKQGGGWITATLNGIVYGNTPVKIGSAADIAIQAQLANNTATTAYFALPFIFGEDFRKSYAAGLKMALPTGFGSFSNGQWVANGNIGGLTLQLTMAQLTGNANSLTAAAITANVEYDNTLAAPGSTIRLSKEKVLAEDYNVGDIEVAKQIKNVDGEMLQYVALVTVADPITKVVIKQGEKLWRTQTWEENISSLRRCGVNVSSIPRNVFLIVFDRKDDPTTGLAMKSNAKLSITATFGSAADNPTSVRILAGIYGPMD